MSTCKLVIEDEVNIKIEGLDVDIRRKLSNALKFDTLTFDQAYDKQLKIMDMTAFTLCKENEIPVVVFDMNNPGNLKKVILGDKIGTLVTI